MPPLTGCSGTRNGINCCNASKNEPYRDGVNPTERSLLIETTEDDQVKAIKICVTGIFGLFLMLALSFCKGEKKPATGQADSLAIVQDDSLPKEAGETLPSWFREIPQKPGTLYAVGRGGSSRINLSRERALLNAQAALARLFAQGKNKATDSLNVLLTRSHVVKEKQVRRGNRWYTYVLIEMPFN